MAVFLPSELSEPAADYSSWAALIAPAISVAGGLVSTGIQVGAARKAQKQQQESDLALAREQAQLLRMQAQAAQAQQAALAKQTSSFPWLWAAGILSVVGAVAGGVYFLRKKQSQSIEEAAEEVE